MTSSKLDNEKGDKSRDGSGSDEEVAEEKTVDVMINRVDVRGERERER